MKDKDVPLCIHVHSLAFKGFFLTFLGPRFLTELYTAILCDASGICMVSSQNNQISGFVVGSSQSTGLYKRLLKQRLFSFGIATIPAVLRNPTIIPRVFRAFSKPSEVLPVPNCGTLMSIAVYPSSQGNSIGQMLVRAFLQEASNRGLEYVNLTTDRLNNDHANRFYQRLGFELCRQFTTPEGRQMNEYLFHLTPEALKTLSPEG
jgi:ribosomal protein S18 acetylase RimI-like enzyme